MAEALRTGVIAQKKGMTHIYDEQGSHVPVTVLHVDKCQVVAVKTVEKNGYDAVQVGVGSPKPNRISKPLRAQFAKAKVEPKQKLAEFRVSKKGMLGVGDEVTVNHFIPGQFVDVQGDSIGKGYAGVIKRHNFGGLEATHGISKAHRSHGSTGQCQDPGRVFKGKKMAGQMGNTTVTQQNLQIVDIDDANGIILVKGGIPGAKGSYVRVTDAVKCLLPINAPYPTASAAASNDAGQAEEKNAEEGQEAQADAVAEQQPQNQAEANATPEEDKGNEN